MHESHTVTLLPGRDVVEKRGAPGYTSTVVKGREGNSRNIVARDRRYCIMLGVRVPRRMQSSRS